MKNHISSIEELITYIKTLPANKTIWYRGHSDASWPLIPSVQRPIYRDHEQALANNFYMRASVTLKEKPDFRSYSDWLTIMRHYGLPTRLLDWSRSPLIASYFAVSDWRENPSDACIWTLYPEELNEREGFKNYLYSVDSHTAIQMLRPAYKDTYVPDNPNVINKILACYPIEHDLRVYVQQSAFTVHNTQRRLEDILPENVLKKLIIPGEAKQALCEELMALGISVSYIYPDSEHIAQELVQKYDVQEE